MLHNKPGDAASIPAETALEMAKINGAKALGLGHLIGSLEIGKRADFVAINMREVALHPATSCMQLQGVMSMLWSWMGRLRWKMGRSGRWMKRLL